MAVGLENRLQKITDSLKELKVSYATVGSAVKYYIQKSSNYRISAGNNTIKIRFTPTYELDNVAFIKLTPYFVTDEWYGWAHAYTPQYYQEIQTNPRSVTITITEYTGSGTLSVYAAGTSPGTFTRIS